MATTFNPGDVAEDGGVYPVLGGDGQPVGDYRVVKKGQKLPDDIGAFVYGAPLQDDDAEAAQLILDRRGQDNAPVSFAHAQAMVAVERAEKER